MTIFKPAWIENCCQFMTTFFICFNCIMDLSVITHWMDRSIYLLDSHFPRWLIWNYKLKTHFFLCKIVTHFDFKYCISISFIKWCSNSLFLFNSAVKSSESAFVNNDYKRLSIKKSWSFQSGTISLLFPLISVLHLKYHSTRILQR